MKLHKVGALAAVSILAFAACSSSTSSTAPSAAASGGAAANQKDAVCKDKVGKSTTEIHVYSSLPLQGTSLPQSTSIVNAIKETFAGQKMGNFDIKYISLDDASAAKNGDWDGTVETSNANKAANDPDERVRSVANTALRR